MLMVVEEALYGFFLVFFIFKLSTYTMVWSKKVADEKEALHKQETTKATLVSL